MDLHPQAWLSLVSQAEAVQAYQACAGLDPDGLETPAGAAASGDCYRLTTPSGSLIYTARLLGDAYWVQAAAGVGQGMTAQGLAVIEHQARTFGCSRVAFQTVRRGLVRRARALGYQCVGPIGRGVILQKVLSCR